MGRWRTCSRFALLCEIPCRIEKVRDNLGGGVFRQGSRGCYFGVRSTPRGVTTVQAGSMPSKSRKPREWPIHPKPDIPGRLPERLLRPRSRHSGSDARRSAKLNERRKLGRPIGARNGGNWVGAARNGGFLKCDTGLHRDAALTKCHGVQKARLFHHPLTKPA